MLFRVLKKGVNITLIQNNKSYFYIKKSYFYIKNLTFINKISIFEKRHFYAIRIKDMQKFEK